MPISNKRKRSAKNHEKSLTYEEKNKLSEIDLLYNTNLFKLKAEEFLKEFTLDDIQKEEINKVMVNICNKLKNMKELTETSLEEVVFSYKNGSIILPVSAPTFNTKQLFRIGRLENITAVGGYVCDSFDISNHIIDIGIEMPIDFTKEDFKSKSYFLKRALFLCHIARHLQDSSSEYELKFIIPYGQWFPCLVIEWLNPRVSFVLYPFIKTVLASDFKHALYCPDRRNLKIPQTDRLITKENEKYWNTPFYNQYILRDLKLNSALSALHELIKKSKPYSDSLILLKSWVRKRVFGVGLGCVSGMMITAVFAYLINDRKIHPFMQPFQIIRIFINFIASDTLSNSQCSFYKQEDLDSKFKLFKSNFPLVLLDSSGDLNYLFTLSKNNYDMFVYDAAQCLEGLNSSSYSSENIFDNIFLTQVEYHDTFDHYFKFELTDKSWLVHKSEKLYIQSLIDVLPSDYDQYYLCISRILKRGLADRVRLLYHKNIQPYSWSINQYPQYKNDVIWFGLILNIDHCMETSILGPAVNDTKALEFRDLWGSISKPYKLPDSSVKEMVYFSHSGNDVPPQPICQKIVSHLITLHCNMDLKTIFYFSSQLDSVLHPKNSNLYKPLHLDQNYVLLEEAFNQLSTLLLNNHNENLKIKNVFSTSNHLLRTSIVCPPPIEYSKIKKIIKNDTINKGKFYRESVEMILKLSVSNNTLSESMYERECTKIILISQLAQDLRDLKINANTFTDHLDVYFNGFLFQIQIYLPKELKLIYSINESKGDSLKSWSPSLQKLAIQFHYKPLHCEFIKKISYLYKTYSHACRLFKRWISSQLLCLYFSENLCELIVAYIFLNPLPTYNINSPLTGFRRTLKFLFEFNWMESPLILSFEKNDIPDKIINNIKNGMRHNRSEFPPMVILSPYDESGVLWSSDTPSHIILNRIIGLSRASYKLITSNLINFTQSSCSNSHISFLPNLEDFNIVIDINPSVLSDSYINLSLNSSTSAGPNDDSSSSTVDQPMSIILYNPIEAYVEELKKYYGDIMTIFYDPYNSHHICVVLKTKALESIQFNVTNCSHKEPLELTTHHTVRGKCQMSIDRIVDDMRILGKGICRKINVNLYKN